MSTYCFFIKSDEVVALEMTESQAAAELLNAGYQKQFEEIDANTKELALARFADIRGEELKSTYAFAGESTFSGLITSFLSR
ncbi:TPA: hypothetical protein ACS7XC_002183 [Providencia alcalifaciens]|uniref:Uncharacterized protein n=1 Tax=Providencia alcalifaciens DSM 30120 TaxID=520999 RepID=B6XE59_9GAMM|nr:MULTISPECIES: hypothetical protein [Providencia]ATG15266.1 hypothetical protein CO695_02715 [Providencia alcalifaciens]EEB46337.1 hypothetical protein PROVALCAL_01635 [Providencia alcalifaciens DSM 30120]EKT62892.1 hypothetical protein OO9_18211 [Providencia alcalifaciens Dmel2]EUD04611.1 hypothetical protein HMPREF1565_0014 [Providencia alcalifaciens RIMD 1656011]EUD05669.1 hypothetical protein HMPREF1564_2272 [Providencia alcalifaciens R90-1475]